MMTIIDRINEDLKNAMRSKNKTVLTTLRGVKTAVVNLEKQGNNNITDLTLIAVIKNQVKQRQDSIECFEKAKRNDLIEVEQNELEILTEYLPIPLSTEVIETEILNAITLTGATSIKDMGKVMSVCKEKFEGRADNSMVAKIIKEKLK